MCEKDMTFTIDELDDAVAEECVKITMDHGGENAGATALLIMTGMSFCAAVKRHLINNKKTEE